MTKEIMATEAVHVHQNLAVENSRAIQEVQASLIIAKRFPRDENAAFARIMTSCKRISLATHAIYNLPISGRNQSGPSIRLAEVLAQAWGNLKFGFKEYSRADGVSSCNAYCWDQETNTNSEIDFEVEHFIIAKGAKKFITDPAEIDRLIANKGSKKLRQCILKVIPPDIVEEAMNQCKETIKKGDGSPIGDRIRKMVAAFSHIGVTQEMIEKRVKKSIDLIDPDELVDLTATYKSLVDNQAKKNYYFDTGEEEKPKSSSLNEKLSIGNPKPTVETTIAPLEETKIDDKGFIKDEKNPHIKTKLKTGGDL